MMTDDPTLHMSIDELAEELAGPDAPTLIDVREVYEFETGHIDGAKNVPLGEIASLFDDPVSAGPMVFICEAGVRSLHAAQFGRVAGVEDVRSVDGGMAAWRSTRGM